VKSVVKSNRSFILPFFIFLIVGAIVLLITGKTERHVSINQYHNSFFDSFFYYSTYMGDGVMALLAFVLLLAIKYRYAFIVGLSALLSSMVTQVLKRFVFDDFYRPKKFFEGLHDLYLVPGVDNHLYYSFPSGHATTAFALYFSMALIIKNNIIKLLLFIIAFVVSFSRVYLSQHFFEDIYAGAFIGTTVTLIIFLTLKNNNKPWLDKSVVSFFR
jgi:membrane-associated phospholipid phosphatase